MNEQSAQRIAKGAAEARLSRQGWRIFQIMGEFLDGYEKLSVIRPSVSIFGLARIARVHPWLVKAEETARLSLDAGFSAFSGGGGYHADAIRRVFSGKRKILLEL